MLDKSKGLVLGVNTLINGDFSQGSVGWTLAAGVTVENSQLNFNATSGVLVSQEMPPLVVGKWYVVEFDLVSYTSGTPRFYYGVTQYPSISTVTGRKKYIVSPTGNGNFGFTCISSGAVFSVDNVSVKELQGNHAYQTTSAARPILRDTPRRIDFDAVDDKLITNLQAQLTGCTVIRAIPSVGTQILTGRTIPATYEDNKDHCGLIVINRVLTPSETSAITAEFNKRAGV
jgi:hypothetical protein